MPSAPNLILPAAYRDPQPRRDERHLSADHDPGPAVRHWRASGGGNGPLSILRFADAQSLGVVHLPGPGGGICLDSPPDLASHTLAFTLLKASALIPAATTRLLRDMAAR